MLTFLEYGAYAADSFEQAFMKAHETFRSAYPRLEGSEGEDAAVAYITEVLEEHGIRYTQSDFDEFAGGHSFSTSINATIKGRISDEVVFVVPLNHPEHANPEEDGSVNIAIATALASTLSGNTPPLSVRLLFLGAEHGRDAPYPMGTRQFLQTYRPEFNSVVIYSDFSAVPTRIAVRAGDKGTVSPYWLTESCSTSLDDASLGYLVRGNENQFYRLGVSNNPAPLQPYLDQSIPALSFHTLGRISDAGEIADWAHRFYEFFLAFLIDNENGFTREWDRHYLFFQVRSYSTIITEQPYLILVIVILSIMILYPLIAPDRFRKYVSALASRPWTLPALLALVFGLLLIGTLMVEAVFLIKGFPSVWESRPFLFFSLKLSTAIFLFLLLFRYFRRIPFPRRGRFYNAAALFILYCDILILGYFDISLSYYVVWACIFAFFFSLFRSRFLKTICFLASPIWFIKAMYDVFSLPEMNLAEQMLLSTFEGNLVFAFVLLPFLTMVIRLDFMFRHPKQRTRRILASLLHGVFGVVFGALFAYLSFYSPYTRANPQPVEAKEIVDLSLMQARLEVVSPAPLPEMTVTHEGETSRVDVSSRNYTAETPLVPDIVSVNSTTSRFLGRKRLQYTISSKGNPSEVSVQIQGPEEIVLYDASFPYSYETLERATIHIGRNPPNPLQVEFTLPEGQAGILDLRIRYENPPTELGISADTIEVDRNMVVLAQIEL